MQPSFQTIFLNFKFQFFLQVPHPAHQPATAGRRLPMPPRGGPRSGRRAADRRAGRGGPGRVARARGPAGHGPDALPRRRAPCALPALSSSPIFARSGLHTVLFRASVRTALSWLCWAGGKVLNYLLFRGRRRL